LFAGCGGGGDGGAVPSNPESGGVDSVDTSQLCVSSSCGERVVLVHLPGAENQIFTDDGRLFVSAGSGVYEITKDAAGQFSATLLNGECGFTGLAIRENYLYAACGDSRFYAGPIPIDPTATPVLTRIFDFEGMCIPNGMSLGPDGNLYVVDEPLNVCIPDPKIVRLTVDPDDPMRIVSQEVWVQGSALGLLFLGLDNVLRFPNGLVRDGNSFYGTDGGSVFRVDWQPDGSAAPVQPLFFEITAHDDIGLAGDGGLVAADFLLGKLVLISRDGRLLQQTDPLLFTLPSSVRLGRPPMFAPDDLVVTERIVVADSVLPLGQVSVFRRRQP
jgi:hypothetical protein